MGFQTSLWKGCPIRILRVLRLYAAPPERFAGLRVLLRLQAPRHPPRTHLSVCSLCLRCVYFLCFNSCCAARGSKIEGISSSVVKVQKV
jgi:hypothetical protein